MKNHIAPLPFTLQIHADLSLLFHRLRHFLLLFLGICLFLSINPKTSAQNQGIHFLDTSMTWEQLIKEANTVQKLLFIYVFEENSTSCSNLENYVFAKSDIAARHNRYFINYKINGKIQTSEGFVSAFEIGRFPALLFFDANGELIQKTMQTPPPSDYSKLIDAIVADQYSTSAVGETQHATSVFDNNLITIPSPNYNAQPITATPEKRQATTASSNASADKSQQIKKWEKAYYANNIQAKDLYEYAYALKESQQSYHAVVNDYLKTQRSQLEQPFNRKFLFDFVETVENDAIQLFMKDIHHFKVTQGSEKINNKIKNAIYNSILTAIKEHDKIIFKDAVNIIHQADLPFKDSFEFEMTTLYFKGTGEWKNYAETAIAYVHTKNITAPQLLNELAANIALNLDDVHYLEQALKWAQMSVKIENEYHFNHTLAFTHYRLGQYEMAMKVAEYALNLAEIRKINPKEIKDLIDDIRTRKR